MRCTPPTSSRRRRPPTESAQRTRAVSTAALRDASGRRARRGLLGHRARGAVRARRAPGAAVGPRCAAAGAHGARAPQRALPARHPLSRLAGSAHRAPGAALAGARDVLVAVPSLGLRVAAHASSRRTCPPGMRVAWATKGFEADSGKLPHQVAREVLGAGASRWRCCPGPTFAREVGAGLPTAMTIASPDAAYAQAAGRGALVGQLPRLHLHGHHGRGDRRGGEERARRRVRGSPTDWASAPTRASRSSRAGCGR